jgi:hypothetical protein
MYCIAYPLATVAVVKFGSLKYPTGAVPYWVPSTELRAVYVLIAVTAPLHHNHSPSLKPITLGVPVVDVDPKGIIIPGWNTNEYRSDKKFALLICFNSGITAAVSTTNNDCVGAVAVVIDVVVIRLAVAVVINVTGAVPLNITGATEAICP